MKRVVVVGAGVSGLAAATFMEEDDLEVTVLEAAQRPGGNVRTDIVEGRVVDHAANGWLDNEPVMGRLLDRLGLTAQVVPAGDRFGVRWVFCGGRMVPVPTTPPAFLRSALLPFSGKLRVLGDVFVPRGGDDPDETVGAFVRRRLGAAAVDRLVGPMVAGIHAADPDTLSLGAAFPRMAQLEAEHRSLILASIRLRRGGAPPGHLQTLPEGAGQLTAVMADRLGDRLRCGTPAAVVEERRDGWRVHTDGEVLSADAVVLACPGHAQARLVRGVDADLAQALEDIPYAPVAVVVTGWSPGSWVREPEGFGVLRARGALGHVEGADGILGTVFTSSVFPSQAPPGEVLLRTIIGGGVAPEAAGLDDQVLLGRVRRFHAACFGPEARGPIFTRVYRHPRGIPQYTTGHLGRVAVVRAAEARRPGLVMVGNHLEGIGVKDCARNGEEAAARVRRALGLA